MAKYVKLGNQAGIFHDPASGVTVIKGEVKQLTPIQANLPRVRKAINAGHLVLVDNPNVEVNDKSGKKEIDLDKLFNDLNSMTQKGMEPEAISKKFNMEELKAMAEESDIEVEESDTKLDIVKALIEE